MKGRRWRSLGQRVLVVWTLILIPRPSLSQLPPIVPLGSEFQVNGCTLGRHDSPGVAMAPGGEFTVVWDGICRTQGLFGRRFTRNGDPLGFDFDIGRRGPRRYRFPRVAVGTSGGFLVAYTGGCEENCAELGYPVYGQFYDREGRRMGEEVEISPHGTFALVGVAGDSFVVVGQVERTPGRLGPFARQYSTDGGFTNIDIETTAFPVDLQSLATDPAGGLVVVFEGYSAGQSRLLGRRFSNSGVPGGGEIPIATDTTGAQVVADSKGGFIVVWGASEGNRAAVLGKRYDSQGTVLGTEFRVNENTIMFSTFPLVVTDQSGGFTVLWANENQQLARRYSESAMPISGEFPLGAPAQAAAADATGNFVVVWQEAPDSYSYTVRGRRFALCNATAEDPVQCRTPVTATPSLPRSTPTPTATSTSVTAVATATPTSVATLTPPSPATQTPSSAATEIVTGTPLPPASATPRESEPPEICVADCNGDGTVAIDELMLAIGKALGEAGADPGADLCGAADPNGDGRVAIEELVRAVNALIRGCDDEGS